MIVISWKKIEKGKLYMCHTDFVIYYKLPEGRDYPLALVVGFLLPLFCQAVGFVDGS